MFARQYLLSIAALLFFCGSMAAQEPQLFCPCQPRQWSLPSDDSLISLFNEKRQSTSIISGLDFDLMQSRSDYLRNVISGSSILPDGTSTWFRSLETFVIANRVIIEHFGERKPFDFQHVEVPQIWDSSIGELVPMIVIDSSHLKLLEDTGNATYAYSTYENVPVYRKTVSGQTMISLAAGIMEIKEQLYENRGYSRNTSNADARKYYLELRSNFRQMYSTAFENEAHDYLVLSEVQAYLKFRDSLSFALPELQDPVDQWEVYPIYQEDFAVDQGEFGIFDYQFLGAYRSDYESTNDYTLGDWIFEYDLPNPNGD